MDEQFSRCGSCMEPGTRGRAAAPRGHTQTPGDRMPLAKWFAFFSSILIPQSNRTQSCQRVAEDPPSHQSRDFSPSRANAPSNRAEGENPDRGLVAFDLCQRLAPRARRSGHGCYRCITSRSHQAYCGEVYRSTVWRARRDNTTNWAAFTRRPSSSSPRRPPCPRLRPVTRR